MLLTQAELSASALPTSEVEAFLASNPLSSTEPNDYLAVRNALSMFESRALSLIGPTPPGVVEIYHPITMRDDWINTVKIIRPAAGVPGPLLAPAHAGGFVGGSSEQLTAEARALVRLFGATVVNVSYRRAPEHKFPTPQLDFWDCCEWISDHVDDPLLNADPSRGFILGGVSVGGSMTAALSRKFQDEPLSHALTGQWLCVASLMDDECVPARYRDIFFARKQSSDAPFLNKANLESIQRWSQWDHSSDLRYAMNSKSDMLQQPRAYLQVGAMDPYRDDTLVYDELLREADLETRIDFYFGCPHLHWMIMPQLEISRKTRIDTLVGLGWLLRRDLSREEAADATL